MTRTESGNHVGQESGDLDRYDETDSVGSREGEAEEDNSNDFDDDVDEDAVFNNHDFIFGDMKERFACYICVLLLPHRRGFENIKLPDVTWWDTLMPLLATLPAREMDVLHSLTTLNVDPAVSKRKKQELAAREKDADQDYAAHKDDQGGYSASSFFGPGDFFDDEIATSKTKPGVGNETDPEFLLREYGALLRDIDGNVSKRVSFLEKVMPSAALTGTLRSRHSATLTRTTASDIDSLFSSPSVLTSSIPDAPDATEDPLSPEDSNVLAGHDLELASDYDDSEPNTRPPPPPLREGCSMQDAIQKYNLNKRQAFAFRLLASARKLPVTTDPLFVNVPKIFQLIITGMGGSGKTESLKASIEYNEMQPTRKDVILKMSELGSVAAQIGGYTLCRLFGSNMEGSRPSLARESVLLRGLDCAAVDEISMVKRTSWHYLDMAIQDAKGLKGEHFPRMSSLLLGDCYQLAPVGSKSMFQDGYTKTDMGFATYWVRRWFKDIPNCIVLSQNHRAAKTERRLRDFLLAVRYGRYSLRHSVWIRSRTLTSSTAAKLKDVPTLICDTNRERSAYVDAVMKTKISARVLKVYKWVCPPHNNEFVDTNLMAAYHALCVLQRDGPKSKIKAAPIFRAFVGMPVVITNNSGTEIGVANGSSGIIHALHFPINTTFVRDEDGVYVASQPPVYVDVDLTFTPSKAPVGYGTPSRKTIRPVPLIQQEHTVDYFDPTGARVSRKCKYFGLPLLNGYASTVHSAQGRTITRPICISSGLLQSKDAMKLYVAASRVTLQEYLFFESPINLSDLNQFVMPAWVTTEWNRLNRLCKRTIATYFKNEPDDDPDDENFSDLDDTSDLKPSGASVQVLNLKKRKGHPRREELDSSNHPPAKRVKGDPDLDFQTPAQSTSEPNSDLADQVLFEFEGIQVRQTSRARLGDRTWLDSELVSFFFKFLCHNSHLPADLCYAVDSLVVPNIWAGTTHRTRRVPPWMLGLQRSRFWILPVSLSSTAPKETSHSVSAPRNLRPDHWLFVCYDSRDNIVYVFDSFGLSNNSPIQTFFETTVPHSLQRAAQKATIPTVRVLSPSCYQRDSHSCGVFIIYACMHLVDYLQQSNGNGNFVNFFQPHFQSDLPFNATAKRDVLRTIADDPNRLLQPALSYFKRPSPPCALVNTGNDCWINSALTSLRSLHLHSAELHQDFPIFATRNVSTKNLSQFRKTLWEHRASISIDWISPNEQFEATALLDFFITTYFQARFSVSHSYDTVCQACSTTSHHQATHSAVWKKNQDEIFPTPSYPELRCPTCNLPGLATNPLNYLVTLSDFLFVNCIRVTAANTVSRHLVNYPPSFEHTSGETFSLACVGVHDGAQHLNQGHWYVLTKNNGRWYYASDSTVHEVPVQASTSKLTNVGFLVYKRNTLSTLENQPRSQQQPTEQE
jgi:hypothetical protein